MLGRGDNMDIFDQIKKEHREVEVMLQELSRGHDKQLIKKLKISITAHLNAEEGTLYPAMEGQDHEMVESAQERHKEIRKFLGLLGKGEMGEFPLKVSKLSEVINDHFRAEEQNVLTRAQEMLDQEKVEVLSFQFNQINRRMRESVL